MSLLINIFLLVKKKFVVLRSNSSETSTEYSPGQPHFGTQNQNYQVNVNNVASAAKILRLEFHSALTIQINL